MANTAITNGTGTPDTGALLAGVQHAARVAAGIAESATLWAESARAGLEAARDARAAAMLARSVADMARPEDSEPLLRIAAADAREAVERAAEAMRRVTRAVGFASAAA